MQIKHMGPLTQEVHGWGGREGQLQQPSTLPPFPPALPLHGSLRSWPPSTDPRATALSQASLAITPSPSPVCVSGLLRSQQRS